MAIDTLIYKYPTNVKWTVAAGTRIQGYKWDPVLNREVGPRKVMEFDRASSASADADYVITGTTTSPHGRTLHVVDGVFAGMIITKSLVTVNGTPSSTPINPSPPADRPPSTNIFVYPPRFQFGQSNAPTCGGLPGRACCTDTCVQMVIEYWKDKFYTLNHIRATSGETSSCSGLSPGQAMNALRAHGVYNQSIAVGIDATFIFNKLKAGYGPIMTGVYYGKYPNHTNGRCGTYNRAEYSGRTDCNFRGPHAVLVIGYRYHNGHVDVYVRDPDHNSASRPEDPKYDIITLGQLNTAIKALPAYTSWNTTYCIYPKTKKTL